MAAWQIADKLKNKHGLSGTINAGATLVIARQQRRNDHAPRQQGTQSGWRGLHGRAGEKRRLDTGVLAKPGAFQDALIGEVTARCSLG
jgi:hypothetical protein